MRSPHSTAATRSVTPPASPPFGRAEFDRAERTLLGRGRWPKAALWRVRIGNAEWVVKDFSERDLVARGLFGRLLLRRELRALQRVAGIKGVPSDVFRIDRHAFAYRFVPGRPLASIHQDQLPTELFEALERTLRDVHARGIVHLDIRNCRNVIVNDRDEPVLLDFESHLDTRGWLSSQRERLETFDLAGVYKHWARAKAASLGPQRLAVLERMNRWRKMWVFRGLWYYPRQARKMLRRLRHRDPHESETETRR
jgi:hypothetical protein